MAKDQTHQTWTLVMESGTLTKPWATTSPMLVQASCDGCERPSGRAPDAGERATEEGEATCCRVGGSKVEREEQAQDDVASQEAAVALGTAVQSKVPHSVHDLLTLYLLKGELAARARKENEMRGRTKRKPTQSSVTMPTWSCSRVKSMSSGGRSEAGMRGAAVDMSGSRRRS